ncbi:hypothetical protein ACFYVL_40495 [Streptomyces sp. NPDC004111]|uniref:hypothetical protein n=1 Tax=Streptomyces sp. NPDC004111 TaxID=3364690 RepID=UPI0036C561A1
MHYFFLVVMKAAKMVAVAVMAAAMTISTPSLPPIAGDPVALTTLASGGEGVGIV